MSKRPFHKDALRAFRLSAELDMVLEEEAKVRKMSCSELLRELVSQLRPKKEDAYGNVRKVRV